MRKVFANLMLLTSVFFGILFFILLNISYSVNESRIKSLLAKSKFYDTAAFYIKDEIVKGTEFQLNEGSNFEDLNSKISASNVKESIDTAIHNVFVALENPTPGNKVFPIRFYTPESENGNYFFEKYANLENNKFFDLLSNKGLLLLETGGIALLLFALGILTFSSKIIDRLLISGITIITLAVFLLVIAVSIKYLALNYVDLIVGQANLVQEAKLLSVVRRVSTLLFNRQVLFCAAEFVGLLIIAVTTLGIRKIFLKESLQEIGKKI